MSKGTRRLGRGLTSLISSDLSKLQHDDEPQPATNMPTLSILKEPTTSSRFLMLPVGVIRSNPMQPRRHFDEQQLSSLASSIRQKGTLQPIVVRPKEGGYELVAGERRLRAAKLAGLSEIPVLLRRAQDDELLELALIENIHRSDLNPIERARAYRILHEQHKLSHEQIAQRVGEDRATVTNYMRLLNLTDEVIELVNTNELGVGHAKALLGCSDSVVQISLAKRSVQREWSVRRLEKAISQDKKPRESAARERPIRPAVRDMEQRLSDVLGTRVIVREGRRRHTGRLVIEYYSLDDFERILGQIGITEEH